MMNAMLKENYISLRTAIYQCFNQFQACPSLPHLGVCPAFLGCTVGHTVELKKEAASDYL